jgi:hypothetical protein
LRAAQLKRMSGWTPPSWEAHFASVDRWLTQLQQTKSASAPNG